MKIAVSGKGGVGKTTLSAMLAYLYAKEGMQVVLIDADPDGNLACALGCSDEIIKTIIPISQMKELIQERTGITQGASGSFFKLNPMVNDIPDRFSLKIGNIRLLVMGGVSKGGGGCVCPVSVLIKNLVGHLLLNQNEIVIMDMEAGIEHLGRATAKSVDAFIVVVEPGQRSIQTARKVQKLAAEIGIKKILVVCNKIRHEKDIKIISDNLSDIKILGSILFNSDLIEADILNKPVFENRLVMEQIEQIKQVLEIQV